MKEALLGLLATFRDIYSETQEEKEVEREHL